MKMTIKNSDSDSDSSSKKGQLLSGITNQIRLYNERGSLMFWSLSLYIYIEEFFIERV